MPEPRYPTLDEFWKRLDVRRVEPDLRDALRARTTREAGGVRRVGREPTVVAVVARLLPGTPVPPEALAAFLDDTFDLQMGKGDERSGTMPRAEMIPAGFAALDAAAGGDFAALDTSRQDDLLAQAERKALDGPAGFDSSAWFNQVRALVLLGFGSDPRGMVFMGFPGPAYQPGYLWLGTDEVKQRTQRRPGHTVL
ncbi:MAG: gluconate 2-dehydrogenase subunit 3 family protein [Dehalococcoidia bacterium]